MRDEDITWELILQEARKQPEDDPIAKIFLPIEAELQDLRSALKTLVDHAEFDGDISTVDTADLRAAKAVLEKKYE